MKILLSLALAASLSACATDTTTRLARADATLARLQSGYEAARSVAALFAPWLTPAQAARLDALGRAVEIALAAARAATGVAARQAALDRAAAATAAYRLAAGG